MAGPECKWDWSSSHACDMGTGTLVEESDKTPEWPHKADIPMQGIGSGSLTRKSTVEQTGV